MTDNEKPKANKGVDLAELIEVIRRDCRRVAVEFREVTFEIEYCPGAISDGVRIQLSASGDVNYKQISALVHDCLLDWTLTSGEEKLPLEEFDKLPGEIVEAMAMAILKDLRPNPKTPAG